MASNTWQSINWKDPFLLEQQLSDDQRMVRDTAHQFAQEKLLPRVREAFRNEETDPSIFQEMGSVGLLGSTIQGYDCPGVDYMSYGLIAREVERVDSGYRSMMSVQSSLVMYPIYAFGSEEQKEKYLPGLAKGEKIGCFGLTEPDYGSDAGGSITRAKSVDGGYSLSGAKMWISNSPIADVFVLVLVSTVTVFFDLAIAVVSGVIVSALVFSWENAKRIRARKRIKTDGTKIYEIWGPLFFGSISAFNEKFDVKNDPNSVEIDFVESRVSDHSALEAIFVLVEKYHNYGKKIKLKHLSEDCKILLYKASPIFHQIIEEDIDDPRYHLAANPEKFPKSLSEYKF